MLSRLTKTEFELFGFIRNRWYFKRFIEPGPKISMSKEVQKKEGRKKRGTFMQSVLHRSLGVGGSMGTRIGSERQLSE